MSPQTAHQIRIALTAIFVLLGLAGGLPAAFSVMLFDAPGSERQVLTWILVAVIVSWPILCFVAIALSWRFREKGAASLWFFLLPIPSIVACGLVMFG